jgi:histidinol-phosphatase
MFEKVKLHAKSLQCTDLEVALIAAKAAGRLVHDSWHKPRGDFRDKFGSHYELVSEVDESADEEIQSLIKSSFPDDKIVSEEISPDASGFDVKKGRVWIIDPLDGTSAFLFKCDPFCPSVMIALLEDGITQVSVVYQPVIDHWSYAVFGRGAFLNAHKTDILTDNKISLKDAWVDMNHYGDMINESVTFKSIESVVRCAGGARLVTRLPPASNIAIRLLVEPDNKHRLGACIHDHNPEKPKQCPWDIIPIKLIIEEAGGLYIDSHKGRSEPLDPFNLEGPIIVGGEKIVLEILARIKH